jgi:hypothetical protein
LCRGDDDEQLPASDRPPRRLGFAGWQRYATKRAIAAEDEIGLRLACDLEHAVSAASFAKNMHFWFGKWSGVIY